MRWSLQAYLTRGVESAFRASRASRTRKLPRNRWCNAEQRNLQTKLLETDGGQRRTGHGCTFPMGAGNRRREARSPAARATARARAPDPMVAASQVRNVYSLGPVQRDRPS